MNIKLNVFGRKTQELKLTCKIDFSDEEKKLYEKYGCVISDAQDVERFMVNYKHILTKDEIVSIKKQATSTILKKYTDIINKRIESEYETCKAAFIDISHSLMGFNPYINAAEQASLPEPIVMTKEDQDAFGIGEGYATAGELPVEQHTLDKIVPDNKPSAVAVKDVDKAIAEYMKDKVINESTGRSYAEDYIPYPLTTDQKQESFINNSGEKIEAGTFVHKDDKGGVQPIIPKKKMGRPFTKNKP